MPQFSVFRCFETTPFCASQCQDYNFRILPYQPLASPAGFLCSVLDASARDDDLAVGFGNIKDDLADLRRSDLAAEGILHAVDGAEQVRLYLGALEAQVGVDHLAVDQLQIRAVAQRLGSDDRAVDQGQMVGIPGQILALDRAVFHGHVAGMPETVLGVEVAVVKDGVFQVLEGVFALQTHAGEVQIVAAEHEVFALGRAVAHRQIVHAPAKLCGFDIGICNQNVAALAQGLDAVELGARDLHVVAVPQGGAAGLGQLGVADGQIVVVPAGIAEVEEGVLRYHVRAFLQCALAVGRAVKADVAQGDVLYAVKCAFLIERLVFNQFHGFASGFFVFIIVTHRFRNSNHHLLHTGS